MNQHQEDYLKTIYSLGGDKEIVSNKAIAYELGISPASVTEMLGKLAKSGLAEVFPYKGAKLTAKGVKASQDVALSHRLWEVFLTKFLGYTLSEAHEDAHCLEHVAPERLLRRLDKFLKYPEHCPHGEEIPRGGDYRPRAGNYARLSELMAGERAKVRKIAEKRDLLDYIERLGLKIGVEVEVEKIGEYEGSVSLRQGGRAIVLSHKAAKQITVERL